MKRRELLTYLLLTLSTLYFIYQYSMGYSWDFQVYLMNAKHWLASGSYFEIGRSPLMSLMLGVLLPFGWVAGYLYVIFVSVFFFYTSQQLAKELRLDSFWFYFLSLNPFLLFFGLRVGTELLALALLQLALVLIFRKNLWGGLALGLMVVAKYNNFAYAPLLLLYMDPKKIIKSSILFVVPLTTWLFTSHFLYGHFLFSIADEYAKNVFYRSDIIQSVNFIHFLYVFNILLPVLLVGVYCFFYRKDMFKKKGLVAMIFIAFLAALGYALVPTKIPRYMFNILLPAVYFGVYGLLNLKKIWRNVFVVSFVVITISVFITIHVAVYQSEEYHHPEFYEGIHDKLLELGVENCSVKSNVYVYLNNLGILATDSPRSQLFDHYYDEGYVTVIVKNLWQPEYNLDNYNMLFENDDYYIIKKDNACKIKGDFSGSYLIQLNDIVWLWKDEGIETDPCKVIFENEWLEDKCSLFSLQLDEISNS